MNIQVDPHPKLDLAVFETTFPQPLGEVSTPSWLLALLAIDAPAPLRRTDEIKARVRDVFRYGGYKPTGRGKPASEYLVRAAEQGRFRSINQAVDTCNVVSLHSGLPISVVDLDQAHPPFRIGLAEPDAEYVFNPAGQVIRVGGLLCLHDREGPCANAVKDAQRTKTHETTVRTLNMIWGSNELPGRTKQTLEWYLELLHKLGAETRVITS